MKVIKISSCNQYMMNTEWIHLQEERLSNQMIISFFLLDCSCGAVSLIKMEYSANIPTPLFSSNNITKASFETKNLTCPGCNTEIRIAVPSHNAETDYTRDIRILDSWTTRTKVEGLFPTNNENQNLGIKTQEIIISKLHTEINRLLSILKTHNINPETGAKKLS